MQSVPTIGYMVVVWFARVVGDQVGDSAVCLWAGCHLSQGVSY
ncbi:MAG TPA: hypothetical protein VKA98_09605 [Nitrososphaeraceae archaeon]|nr:hypothetical protein [Nitrososphaeraceae archaeon]